MAVAMECEVRKVTSHPLDVFAGQAFGYLKANPKEGDDFREPILILRSIPGSKSSSAI